MLPVARWIQEVDSLIKAGESRHVREAFAKLDLEKIPRAALLPIATLARRANLPQLTLKILHPIVRRGNSEPSVAERAEYAAALSFIGSGGEALALLEQLDPKHCPDVLLYRCFALFAQWNYVSALPLLNLYLEYDLDPYKRLVGNLNLAAALVHERFYSQASEILRGILEQAEAQNLDLIRGNALELRAQNALFQGLLSTAEQYLFEAEAHLQKTGGIYTLFVRKWKAIVNLKQGAERGDPSDGIQALRKVRIDALARKHWETVRDCDRHEATTLRKQEILWKVYFGTPYSSYRKTLLREFHQEGLKIPEAYFRNFQTGFEPDIILNPAQGTAIHKSDEDRTHTINFSFARLPIVQNVLIVLSTDFYSPFRLPQIFEQLYPGEHYVPGESAEKAYLTISQAREWLKENNVPLAIVESKSFYSLESQEKVAIMVPRDLEVKALSEAA